MQNVVNYNSFRLDENTTSCIKNACDGKICVNVCSCVINWLILITINYIIYVFRYTDIGRKVRSLFCRYYQTYKIGEVKIFGTRAKYILLLCSKYCNWSTSAVLNLCSVSISLLLLLLVSSIYFGFRRYRKTRYPANLNSIKKTNKTNVLNQMGNGSLPSDITSSCRASSS